MKLLIAFFILVSALSAFAQLTPEQQAKCDAEGGCVTLTREALQRALNAAYADGKSGLQCWRQA